MFQRLRRPLLFAHRGASRHAPENTLDAFDLALRLGADVLEMDVHATSDGEVVVLHDATVDRTTDGHGSVRAQTYAEIAKLDAGFRFTTRGLAPFRGRGCTIPRLKDVIGAFKNAALNIDIKQTEPSIVRCVLDCVDSLDAESVLLTSSVDRTMQELEAAKPGCALGLSLSQCKRVVLGAYMVGIPSEFAGRALQIPPRKKWIPLATRWVINAARRAQIETHLWTINDAEDAARWLSLGIDGIFADDVAALVEVIATARGKKHA